MSRPTSFLSRLRGRPASDEGFTLAEVITALMIFGVIAAALIPMLISATRLATIAKLSTQAKQLSVERVESMRNLPYYVAFDNGQYRDILDIYFRDLSGRRRARGQRPVHGPRLHRREQHLPLHDQPDRRLSRSSVRRSTSSS